MKRVVIVGMGFGGVRAAGELSGQKLEVILIDLNNYHLFQPLLYQVATAGLEQESIAYPVLVCRRQSCPAGRGVQPSAQTMRTGAGRSRSHPNWTS